MFLCTVKFIANCCCYLQCKWPYGPFV